MADELLQIRVTADFKEAEGAFLRLGKVATSFESNIRSISANLNRDFNRINGMAELFGDTSNVVADKMEALKRAMNSLMTNGFQALNPEVQKLKAQYDGLASSIQKTTKAAASSTTAIQGTADSAKSSNRQMMNLALVLQDLPYGFRGIQNNLPALLGGIAGVGGAAYLAFSAIIAGLTFWDEHNRKVAASSKKLKEEQTSLNDQILNSKQNALQQGYLLNKYIEIARNATLSDTTRNEALKQANILYGEHNQKLTLANVNTKAVKESIDGYIQSLIQMAVAQKYSGQVADNIIESDKIKAKLDDKNLLRQKLTAEVRGKQNNQSRDLLDVYKDLRGVNKEIYNLELEQGKNISELTNLTNKYSDSLIKATELGAKFGKVKDAKAPKAPKKTKEDTDYYTKIIEQEQKTFTDSLDNELKYADDNNNKKLAILQNYTNTLNHWHELGFIQESFYLNKSADLYKQTYDLKKSIAEQASKDQKVINDRDLQNSLDALKIQSDVESKILLKGGKSTAAERIKILEDYKNKLYDLASIGGFTAEQFDKIDDALLRVDAAIAGSKDKLKDFGVSWTDALNGINSAIMDFINNSIAALGDSIGKALAGENVDVINTFGLLLADALKAIGVQLIALATATLFAWAMLSNPTPLTAALALAAGIAAVAAGALLKSTLTKKTKTNTPAFANGGIISGPTMGLMGEYPGAKSNPEVVAPLDKLKSMIGGGGNGEFVLRGSDLVLALQRSNYSLNLRRGS
jgi:hypothetical protein